MIIRTHPLRLRTGFSGAFKRGLGQSTPLSSRVATRVPASTKEQRYGWMASCPTSVNGWARAAQNISESDYAIRERPWELTIGVDGDDVETDNLGIYSPLFEEMGLSTTAHIEQLVFGKHAGERFYHQLLTTGSSSSTPTTRFWRRTALPTYPRPTPMAAAIPGSCWT